MRGPDVRATVSCRPRPSPLPSPSIVLAADACARSCTFLPVSKMAPVATTNEGNTVYADGRQGKRIENYAAFWQKDLSKEQGQDTENRLANYTDVINGECLSSS